MDGLNWGGVGKNGVERAAWREAIFYGEIKERMAHGLYGVDL
jgi:hypothetical protein